MSSDKNKSESKTTAKAMKEASYGLTKPLNVKWVKNPIIRDYITISVAYSGTRTPTEFVVSPLVGFSPTIPKDSWVINRQSAIPELLKEAPDPMSSRHKKVVREMERDELVKKNFAIKRGDNYFITLELSSTLSGQDVDHYLDRSIDLFEKDKETSKRKLEEDEKDKPFRMRRRFKYEKTKFDFMTKEERRVNEVIQGVFKDLDLVAKIELATKREHSTTLDGEDQKQLVLLTKNWKDFKPEAVASTISKEIFTFLKGTTYPAGTESALLKEEVNKYKMELAASKVREKQIHDYYQSVNTVIGELQAKIVAKDQEIEDISEELGDTKAQLETVTNERDELDTQFDAYKTANPAGGGGH